MSSASRQQQVNNVLYGTINSRSVFDGNPVSALTTLLYKICDDNQEKFEEATQVLELFINKALDVGFSNAPTKKRLQETPYREFQCCI